MYSYLISLLLDVREQRLFITLWKFWSMDEGGISTNKVCDQPNFLLHRRILGEVGRREAPPNALIVIVVPNPIGV